MSELKNLITAYGALRDDYDELVTELDRLRAVEQAATTLVEQWDNGYISTGPTGTRLIRALAEAVGPHPGEAAVHGETP